jgi:hypothetical protein
MTEGEKVYLMTRHFPFPALHVRIFPAHAQIRRSVRRQRRKLRGRITHPILPEVDLLLLQDPPG